MKTWLNSVAACALVAAVASGCATRSGTMAPVPRAPEVVLPELVDAAIPGADAHRGPPSLYPKPTVTPGIVNAAVTQATIAVTICVPGWTRAIRPPSKFTTALKKQQLAALHLKGATKDYEEDHFISLELGGDPTDPKNLWPEPYKPTPGARQKDRVENFLHDAVCHGDLTLEKAQNMITGDWYAVFLQIGAPALVGDPDDDR